MTALALNDLSLSNELDRQALVAVTGGWKTFATRWTHSNGRYLGSRVYSVRSWSFLGVKYTEKKRYLKYSYNSIKKIYQKERTLTF